MVGIVVAAHGSLAAALVSAAEGIVGRLERVATVDLAPSEGLEAAMERLRRAIREVAGPEGVLLLVDLMGGTPANCALSLGAEGRLEVIAGFNLPMILKLATSRAAGQDVAALAAELVEYGRNNVLHASAMLRHRE